MNELRSFLKKSGAVLVGFADVKGLYGHFDPDMPRSEDSVNDEVIVPKYPFAVSMALPIPKEVVRGISDGPTVAYFNAYHELNSRLNVLAELCADYIRERGFNAYPQTAGYVKEYGIFRTLMPHKTAAVRSGLGWIGKSALLVTPEFGPSVRLTSVLTDAPLPCDAPTTSSKCGGCTKCTAACPGKAISGKLWSPGLDRDEFFSAESCRRKARELALARIDKVITLCGKCIEACPYTQRYINS